MGKRKVIWSQRARIKLFVILDFYKTRNKSTDYSQKLFKSFNKSLAALVHQPNIGITTEIESVRGLIVQNFILFYEIQDDFIIVHTLWDCRQHPDDLIIKPE